MGKEKRKTQAQTGQGVVMEMDITVENGARIILMEIRIQEAENIKRQWQCDHVYGQRVCRNKNRFIMWNR